MYSDSDMIVAQATPALVTAPTALIRVSGNKSKKLLDTNFNPAISKECRPWNVRYGIWRDSEGPIDDVLVTFFKGPQSYTGQDMLEISCHGNPLFVELIIKTVLAAGGRLARPGEFTQRAFLNKKMDLLKAELLHDLIESKTRYQADLIRSQVKGPLVAMISEQVEKILQVQAHIEATIDYGEEDIEAINPDGLKQKVLEVSKSLKSLTQSAEFSLNFNRGFKVLLLGEPNAGKSTLFNKLLKRERAIVTPIPGTTRDVLTESVEIDGLPIILMDSAGVRDSLDEIEQLGIKMLEEVIHDVHLVLVLRAPDVDSARLNALKAQIPDHRIMEVFTKADIQKPNHGMAISALTGEGLEALEQQIVLRLRHAVQGQNVFFFNQRQADLLQKAFSQCQDAYEEYASGFGEEILSSHLNSIRRILGEITGETTVEDVLDRMFSNFCLGK